MTLRLRAASAALAGFALAASATPLRAQSFDFIIKSQVSGLEANATTYLGTTGTLIGNYDTANNPSGTRTKPGLFGPFGETENVAVPVDVNVTVGGDVNTRAAGGFRFSADRNAGVASLANFDADLLSGGALSLPISLGLSFDTFRTRNPTFIYPGVPLSIPLGAASLTALTATQVGPAGVGTLTPAGGEVYDFAIPLLVDLAGTIDVLGMTQEIPPSTTPLLLFGQITFDGDEATLLSTQPLALLVEQMPGLAIPQFPLALPTLDPDAPANVLMDLSLSTVEIGIEGALTLAANGVLVPEPAGALLLLIGASLLRLRR